ncbi:MAG: tRNA-binding protein [Phycisphaerales bacterium]|nr:tRNA-binding protein [Phycisphaerales bacterium]
MTREDTIQVDQFASVDMRIGTVIAVNDFPEARIPAWILEIDFGPEIGHLKSSARITDNYNPENLQGRQVIAAINLGDRQIGPVNSQCLVLGLPDADGRIVLLSTDQPVPDGGRVS